MRLMLTEARKHDVTDERTCRPVSELTFVADVFACYFESSRAYRDLVDKKKGRETTVQEAARIVGLELPTNPPS